MITGYKQLTKKYLKSNKKRAILTIVGIILSVALISSIGLFLKGMQDAQIEDMRNTYGSYHLHYDNVDRELIEKISNHPKVGRSGTYNIESEFILDEEINVLEIGATNKALELFPAKVKRGRLPEEKGEVAIEGWLLRHINPNADVGGNINVNNRAYRLVGILENNITEQINNRSIILTRNNYTEDKEAILLAEVSPKTNLKSAVEELEALGKEGQVQKNINLLAMQGATRGDEGFFGLYMVVAVIIAIVVISTIAVIYNSFQISVMERIKEFGLLRAVGTTPKQIRKLILREATLLSLIGIPIGLLFGIVAIYSISLVFRLIGGEDLIIIKPSISPVILGGSGMIGLFSIYLSALLPAIFAGRISPLVAISNRKSITKEKIKRRKGPIIKIIRKTLGFEGELAYKNIKRNRKRYRITVFSIVISVMLFITFKSFIDMSFSITDSMGETENVHFSVVRDVQGTEKDIRIEEDIIEKIKDIPTVNKIYNVYQDYQFDMEIDKNSELKEIQALGQQIYRDSDAEDKTKVYGNINIYDKEAFEDTKEYVESGNIDIDELNKENGVILIRRNRIYNYNSEKTYYGPVADIKVGDEIDVIQEMYQREEKNRAVGETLKVVAIIEQEVFSYRGHHEYLKLITSEEVAKKLMEEKTIKPINLNIVLDNKDSEKVAVADIENAIKNNPNLNIINHIDNNRRGKSGELMVQILLYGFVVVVSLIGSVNIINTLTTNILLRKREFATIRSVGLTHKGLRKMIVLEGMLYGVMGIIYGAIVGTLLSFVLYKGLGDMREFSWSIPWSTIGIATIATLMIGYLSVQYPLAKVKNDNLIETIRGDY
ncbi:FtsX-like permease family protein [Clostridium sp. D2Q-11]|uniref:FtsX-like permease family protein n=1 Tax=Anaeromonas frigoriresistens TaxID=2683708 RepID=A0A942Z776_9FIRM|nr:FtsX-like permease family protein [Anaeromonas frigoriresistens]MBS4538372.1 FtsX-like permease family protein [Anaeromonas frigoriresistens]